MLTHSTHLVMFGLLTAFATPSAAEGKSETPPADSCGYACIFADRDR